VTKMIAASSIVRHTGYSITATERGLLSNWTKMAEGPTTNTGN
jgi:hypothetical protein